jgi:hypothetical protein
MACIKYPFFVPTDQALLIQASKTVRRFMEIVELTDDERVAVEDDVVRRQKLEASHYLFS